MLEENVKVDFSLEFAALVVLAEDGDFVLVEREVEVEAGQHVALAVPGEQTLEVVDQVAALGALHGAQERQLDENEAGVLDALAARVGLVHPPQQVPPRRVQLVAVLLHARLVVFLRKPA